MVIVDCVHRVLYPVNQAPRSRRSTYVINDSAFEINPSRRDARIECPRGWMGAFSERGDHVIPVSGKDAILLLVEVVYAF